MTAKARMVWTFAITSIALFMVTLDNLVVTTALPVIRRDLHAALQDLEWTVNAYTHAPHAGDIVKISSISGWYAATYVGARRY
jgi:MFS family permease